MFFYTKINDIYSYKFKIAKHKKDEYSNKLTTSMLIT